MLDQFYYYLHGHQRFKGISDTGAVVACYTHKSKAQERLLLPSNFPRPVITLDKDKDTRGPKNG